MPVESDGLEKLKDSGITEEATVSTKMVHLKLNKVVDFKVSTVVSENLHHRIYLKI